MDFAMRAYWVKRLNRFLSYVLLIGVGLIILMPLLSMATTSIKQLSEWNVWPIKILPKVPQWSNYANVFTMAPFLKVALRTAGLGMLVTALVTFSSSLIGFIAPLSCQLRRGIVPPALVRRKRLCHTTSPCLVLCASVGRLAVGE